MLLRIVACGLVLLLTGCGLETILVSRWWPAPWHVETEHETTYYRLKVALSHEGQPIDVDIVVGCGVRSQHYPHGSTSVEIGGMYPLVYAVEIPGGHAVKVRTLPVVDGYSMCQGGTNDNGAVPREWMPFVTWYDDARDLSHGIGYATPDAYSTPRSQLEYRGAHVSAATRADFEAFLKTKPVNLVPVYLAGWLLDPSHVISGPEDVTPAMKRDPRTAWKLEGWPACRGVLRIKLDDRQRRLVRSLWPAQRPRIWSLADGKAQRALQDQLWPQAYLRPRLQSWITPYRIDLPKRGPPPAIYPTSVDYGLSRLNRDTGKNGVYYHDSDIGDGIADRGFVYCDSEAGNPLQQAVTGRPVQRANLIKRVCRVDGVTIPTPFDACNSQAWIALGRDEYAIVAIDEFNGC